LRAKAAPDDIVPPLKVFRLCCGKRREDFHHSLRKTLLEEMEIKMPKSESEIVDEPFLLLGYGVNAFFDIQRSLAWMFLIITAIAVPVYGVYSGNPQSGLAELESIPWKYGFN